MKPRLRDNYFCAEHIDLNISRNERKAHLCSISIIIIIIILNKSNYVEERSLTYKGKKLSVKVSLDFAL